MSNFLTTVLTELLPSTNCLKCITAIKSYITKKKCIPHCSISQDAISNLLKTIDPTLLKGIDRCKRNCISYIKDRIRDLIRESIRAICIQKDAELNKEEFKKKVELYFKLLIFEAEHYRQQISKVYEAPKSGEVNSLFTKNIKAIKEKQEKSLSEIEKPSFEGTLRSQFDRHSPSSDPTSNVKRTARSNTYSLLKTREDRLSTSSSSTMTTSTSVSSITTTQMNKISKLIHEFKETIQFLSRKRNTLTAQLRSYTRLPLPELTPQLVNRFLPNFPQEYQEDSRLIKKRIPDQLSTLSRSINCSEITSAPDTVVAYIESYYKLKELEFQLVFLKINYRGNSVTNYENKLNELKESGESLIDALEELEKEPS
ncbi:MAG: hypothetical protein S4CHLAM20_08450 [Chlamydiia bacterium]|nr:hypothetical protein [Chlamydiia bacterium]